MRERGANACAPPHALSVGYLRHLERDYRASLRADYPLFPQGRLVQGAARETAPSAPLGEGALVDMWHALERVADLELVPDRGWYGIRGLLTDRA